MVRQFSGQRLWTQHSYLSSSSRLGVCESPRRMAKVLRVHVFYTRL